MANADWSKPTSSSHYLSFQDELKSRDVDAATQYYDYTGSNQPTGAIRFHQHSTQKRWKQWDGSSWAELTDTYALTSVSVENNLAANGLLTQNSNLALFTNSTQRLQLDSSGAFGFGTAGLGGSNFGTAGQFLASAGSSGVPVWTSVSTGGLIEGYGLFCDEKTALTDGGTFSNGAWRNRDLNTTIAKEGFAFDPSSNRLQLTTVSGGVTTPGKFIICWRAPAFDVRRHQTKAILAATSSPFNFAHTVGYGQNAYSHTTGPSQTWSYGCAYLELPLSGNSSDDRVELIIQHRCEVSKLTTGLGLAADFSGHVERYTHVEVYKLRD
tara:strand:- start:1414 stop:2388 length:975 start_codon:yes stop_codon:yes gene_type:complete